MFSARTCRIPRRYSQRDFPPRQAIYSSGLFMTSTRYFGITEDGPHASSIFRLSREFFWNHREAIIRLLFFCLSREVFFAESEGFLVSVSAYDTGVFRGEPSHETLELLEATVLLTFNIKVLSPLLPSLDDCIFTKLELLVCCEILVIYILNLKVKRRSGRLGEAIHQGTWARAG